MKDLPSLPCGVVLAGGGALLSGLPQLASEVLGAKTRLARPRALLADSRAQVLEGPAHAAIVGLLSYAEREQQSEWIRASAPPRFTRAWGSVWTWAKARLID